MKKLFVIFYLFLVGLSANADSIRVAPKPANPTASVGISAVNGSADTYIRSDGAPAISQAIVPTWSGLHIFDDGVDIKNGATTAGLLRIFEDSDNGANFASITVPALAANTAYTLPPDDGDAGEQLQTNGAGVLTWEAAGSGSGTPGGSDTYVQFNDASVFGGDAGLVYNKTTDTLSAGSVTTLTTFTLSGNYLYTNSAMGALAVDTTKPKNTKTITQDETLTFSAAPATGAWFGLLITNSDTAAHTITIPSSFSDGLGSNRTTFVLAPSSDAFIQWQHQGSSVYRMFGDPIRVVDLTSATPVASDSFEFYDVTDGLSKQNAISTLGGVALVTAAGFNGNLATTDDTLQEIAQKLDDLSVGGATNWTDIADASGDTAIALAGFETDLTSTIDAAGEAVLTITNTDADATADNSIIDLKHNDGADANVFYLRMIGDADGSPTNDYLFSQVGFTSLLPVNVPAEAYDDTGWNADTGAPQKDAIRDKIATLTAVDFLVGTATGELSAEIVAGTAPGGELGGTWGSPTIDDSVTVTGWVMGASTATTPSADDNDTSLATTAYVQTELGAYATDTVTFQNKDLTNANNTLPETWIIACSDETTAITTGTAKVTFRAPYAATITAVRASLTTASSSGIPTIDINDGGTTIMTTNKLTIDANELTSTTAATAAGVTDTALADDAQITIDIDTAGTGAAGLKVQIHVNR
jgi:hypothetical protein